MVFLKKIVIAILFAFNICYGRTQGLEHYEEDPPEYDFSYHVYDPYSRLDFGHFETKNPGRTKGKYFALLPDGRMQTVTYFADASGYHPVVSYEKPIFSASEHIPIRPSVQSSHRQITDSIRSTHARKLTASSSEYNVVSSTSPGPSAAGRYVPNTLFTVLDTGQKRAQSNYESESSSSISTEITNLDPTEKNYNYQQINIPDVDYQFPSHQKSIQKEPRNIKSFVNSYSKELTSPNIKNHIQNFLSHGSKDNNSPERRNDFKSYTNSNGNEISFGTPLDTLRNDKINIQSSELPINNNYRDTNPIIDDSYKNTLSNSNHFINEGSQFANDYDDDSKHAYEMIPNAHDENVFPSYVSNQQTPSQIPSPSKPILTPNIKQPSKIVNYTPDSHEDEQPFNPNTFGIAYADGTFAFANTNEPAFSFSVIGDTPSLEGHQNIFTSDSNSFTDDFSQNDDDDEENGDIYIPSYNYETNSNSNNNNPIISNPTHDNSNSNQNFNYAFNNSPSTKNEDFNSNIQSHMDRPKEISHNSNNRQKNSNFVFINHARVNKTPFPRNIGTSNLHPNLNLPSSNKKTTENLVFMNQPIVPKSNELPKADSASINAPFNKDAVDDSNKSSYTSHTSYGRNRLETNSKKSFASVTDFLPETRVTTTSKVPLTSTYTDIGPVFPPSQQHIINSLSKYNGNQRLDGTVKNFPEESTTKSIMNGNIDTHLTTKSNTRIGSVTNFVPETQISMSSEVPLTSTYTDTGPVFPPTQQHLLNSLAKNNINQRLDGLVKNLPEESTTKSITNGNIDTRLTPKSKTRIGSVTNFSTETHATTTSEVPLTSTYTDIGPVFPPSQQHRISSLSKNIGNQRLGGIIKNFPEESITKSITNGNINTRLTIKSKPRIGSVTNFVPETQISTTSEVPLTSTYTDTSPVFPTSQKHLISSSVKNSVNQRLGETIINFPGETATKSITNGNINARLEPNINFFNRGFASNKETHIKLEDNPKKMQNKEPVGFSTIFSNNRDTSSSSNKEPQKLHEQDVNISHEKTNQAQRPRKTSSQVIKLHNLLDPKFFPNFKPKIKGPSLLRFTHNNDPKSSNPETSVAHINEAEVSQTHGKDENLITFNAHKEVITPPNFNFFKPTNHGMPHPFQDPRVPGPRKSKVINLQDKQKNIQAGMQHPFQNPITGSREVINSQDNQLNIPAPKISFSPKPFEFNLFSKIQQIFSQQSNILNNGHSGSFEVDPDASVVPRIVPVIIPVEDERNSKMNKDFSDHDYGQSGDYLDDDYL